MDARPRAAPEKASATQAELIRNFEAPGGRRFRSWEACRSALLSIGWYGDSTDPSRVDSWQGTRVRQYPDGTWWSDINPAARWLAQKTVLSTSDGLDAWNTLADISASLASSSLPFSVHLWVADTPGSVCTWDGEGGINHLKAILPEAKVVLFEGAGHSIHNSRASRARFMHELKAVIATSSIPLS